MQGLKPIKCTRVPFFMVPEWAEMAGEWLGERGDRRKGIVGQTVTPPHLMRRATFELVGSTAAHKRARDNSAPEFFEDDDDWTI